jgi:c-di-GMP-binding flagellar brake protein YcgR
MDVMFEVSVERRRVYDLPDGRCLVGLAFDGLLPAHNAKLERWILKLQRQMKREEQNQYVA